MRDHSRSRRLPAGPPGFAATSAPWSGKATEVLRQVLSARGLRASGVAAIPLAIVGAVLAGCGGGSVAHATDSTQAYLSARYARERAIYRELPSAREDVTRFVDATTSECRAILADAPRSAEFGQLDAEALSALVVTVGQVDRAPVRAFTARGKRFGWASRRLDSLVRQLAESERFAVSIQVPALCKTLRAWSNAGFRVLPPASVVFLQETSRATSVPVVSAGGASLSRTLTGCRKVRRRTICLAESAHGVAERGAETRVATPEAIHMIWALLSPYESAQQKREASRVEQLEARIANATRALYASAAVSLTRGLGVASQFPGEFAVA